MKKISRFALDMEALAQDPEATHAPLLVDGVRAYSGERDRRFRPIVTGCTV